MQHHAPQPATSRTRVLAWLVAALAFFSLQCAPSSARAQDEYDYYDDDVEVAFSSLQVDDRAGRLAVDYRLDDEGWDWARENDYDLYLALYLPEDDQYTFAYGMPLRGHRGRILYPSRFQYYDYPYVGLCVIAVGVGESITPGYGYMCNSPVRVGVAHRRNVYWRHSNVFFGLSYHGALYQYPWFAVGFGFGYPRHFYRPHHHYHGRTYHRHRFRHPRHDHPRHRAHPRRDRRSPRRHVDYPRRRHSPRTDGDHRGRHDRPGVHRTRPRTRDKFRPDRRDQPRRIDVPKRPDRRPKARPQRRYNPYKVRPQQRTNPRRVHPQRRNNPRQVRPQRRTTPPKVRQHRRIRNPSRFKNRGKRIQPKKPRGTNPRGKRGK